LKAYLVKLKEFELITPKCYKAIDYNGNEDLIPCSQVLGWKGEHPYISEWLINKKSLTFSRKNWVIFDKNGNNKGKIEVKHHKPKKIEFKERNLDEFTR